MWCAQWGMVVLMLAATRAWSAWPEGVAEVPSFDDVAARLSTARVVAFGEGASGTRDYSTFQREVIERLVERHGFRVVFMESVSNDRSLSAFFETCDPTVLADALSRNTWHDHHQERAALYSWICDYNRAHPEAPVRVVSIHPSKPWHDGRTLADLAVELRDEPLARKVGRIRASCFGANSADQTEWATTPETTAFMRDRHLEPVADATCTNALGDARQRLQHLATKHADAAHQRPLGDATRALDNLAVWQTTARQMFSSPQASRSAIEERMADTILWHLTSRGRPRSIVIAHTNHVAKVAATTSTGLDDAAPLMGTLLERAMGRHYVVVALTGAKVASMFGLIDVAPVAADSLEGTLTRLQTGVEPRPMWVDGTAPWLRGRTAWRLTGHEPGPRRRYDVGNAFNTVVFFPQVEAANALAFSARDGTTEPPH